MRSDFFHPSKFGKSLLFSGVSGVLFLKFTFFFFGTPVCNR